MKHNEHRPSHREKHRRISHITGYNHDTGLFLLIYIARYLGGVGFGKAND